MYLNGIEVNRQVEIDKILDIGPIESWEAEEGVIPDADAWLSPAFWVLTLYFDLFALVIQEIYLYEVLEIFIVLPSTENVGLVAFCKRNMAPADYKLPGLELYLFPVKQFHVIGR